MSCVWERAAELNAGCPWVPAEPLLGALERAVLGELMKSLRPSTGTRGEGRAGVRFGKK